MLFHMTSTYLAIHTRFVGGLRLDYTSVIRSTVA